MEDGQAELTWVTGYILRWFARRHVTRVPNSDVTNAITTTEIKLYIGSSF